MASRSTRTKAPRARPTEGGRGDRPRLVEDIREHGLRATGSRVAVLGLLRKEARPMSHGEVVEALTGEPWDKATLYRNLMDLTEVGLLQQAVLGGRVQRFELSDGAHDAAAHAHFVCVECGSVACVPGVKLAVDPGAKKLPEAVAGDRVELHLRGLCDACD